MDLGIKEKKPLWRFETGKKEAREDDMKRNYSSSFSKGAILGEIESRHKIGKRDIKNTIYVWV